MSLPLITPLSESLFSLRSDFCNRNILKYFVCLFLFVWDFFVCFVYALQQITMMGIEPGILFDIVEVLHKGFGCLSPIKVYVNHMVRSPSTTLKM